LSTASCPKALDDGIEQEMVQHPAMDRDLRPLVTGIQSARLAPDRFAPLGEVGELLGPDTGGIELVEQAKLGQFAHRMGQHIDADAQRLEFRHARTHGRECRPDGD
jgi:hypothetical protein